MFINANRMLELGQCDRGEIGRGGGGLDLTTNFHLYQGLGENTLPSLTLLSYCFLGNLFKKFQGFFTTK